MGRLVTELINQATACELTGLVSEPGRARPAGEFHPDLPLLAQDEMVGSLPQNCVIVDFSLAQALPGLLDQARRLKAAIVSGTTGFSPEQSGLMEAYALDFPLVHAANFSLGIPALQMVLQLLARVLPGDFDAAQVETHHRTKLDRPSGTAKHLAAAFNEFRGGADVPTESLRLGGVIGEHTWTFCDQEETLVVSHRAHSRRAFLRGVIPAVVFAANQERGLFSLTDVLKAQASDLQVD